MNSRRAPAVFRSLGILTGLAIATTSLTAPRPALANASPTCGKGIIAALRQRFSELRLPGKSKAPEPAAGASEIVASKAWNRGGTGPFRSPAPEAPIVPSRKLAWEAILEQAARDPDKLI